MVAPFLEEFVPGGHRVHSKYCASLSAKRPAGQFLHSKSEDAYVPFWQGVQTSAPFSETHPSKQPVHFACPT